MAPRRIELGERLSWWLAGSEVAGVPYQRPVLPLIGFNGGPGDDACLVGDKRQRQLRDR